MIVMPIWLQLLFLLGFPIMFFVVLAAWIIDHVWLTPKESKTIKKACRKKKPLAIFASDDGYIDVKMLDFTGLEGYASTSKKKKDKWTGFFARSIEENKGNEEKEKEKEKKISQLINKLSSRKAFFRLESLLIS